MTRCGRWGRSRECPSCASRASRLQTLGPGHGAGGAEAEGRPWAAQARTWWPSRGQSTEVGFCNVRFPGTARAPPESQLPGWPQAEASIMGVTLGVGTWFTAQLLGPCLPPGCHFQRWPEWTLCVRVGAHQPDRGIGSRDPPRPVIPRPAPPSSPRARAVVPDALLCVCARLADYSLLAGLHTTLSAHGSGTQAWSGLVPGRPPSYTGGRPFLPVRHQGVPVCLTSSSCKDGALQDYGRSQQAHLFRRSRPPTPSHSGPGGFNVGIWGHNPAYGPQEAAVAEKAAK